MTKKFALRNASTSALLQHHGKRFAQGLSLIEVLVAIVVISLGLLGAAGMQASGLRTSNGAMYRVKAAQLANDMADRMRANLGDARNYTLALGAAAPSGTRVVDLDRQDWLQKLRELPGGDGDIAIDLATNTVTITVQWDDSRAGGGSAAQYVLSTRLWSL